MVQFVGPYIGHLTRHQWVDISPASFQAKNHIKIPYAQYSLLPNLNTSLMSLNIDKDVFLTVQNLRRNVWWPFAHTALLRQFSTKRHLFTKLQNYSAHIEMMCILATSYLEWNVVKLPALTWAVVWKASAAPQTINQGNVLVSIRIRSIKTYSFEKSRKYVQLWLAWYNGANHTDIYRWRINNLLTHSHFAVCCVI